MRKFLCALLLLCIGLPFTELQAQSNYPLDSSFFKHYNYRSIGPYRGGRASGVCGDYKNKQLFYMAATGGGIWKTNDGGHSWKNISDGFFGGSMGCIEVAPSDALTLYAGAGESTLRGNASEGKGMWKSTDGGRTWKNIGLTDSRHIAKIIVHPRDKNTVYVAAIGHLFGANNERGIFKTTNGGKTWDKVLFVNEDVGASDISMDPTNPNILFAGTWKVRRTHYDFSSGGEGCKLWRSKDGGLNWTDITRTKGLPSGMNGIVTVAIAPTNPEKVYAMIENKNGGLFMSEDGGDSWVKKNSESKIRQRAWYFSRIFIDPKDENLIYVNNVRFHKSTDGGKTFSTIRTPHADHHNMWIDPEDSQRMILADDGGGQVSYNGGKSWSTYRNQATAQFYRVSTDNHFPFRILGCQQDNSSLRVASRTYGGSIGNKDWEVSAGFESGHIVADPDNPEIVYGGNYGGYLSRYNHITKENRTVSVWPISPIGSGADALKYRFQWNFPIFFSPHNSKKLYAAGNELFVTYDEGQSWQSISPDLTTNDKTKQRASGGEITKDNSGVEYYCTIFAAAESPVEEGVLWSGSDDGLVHVSRNSGRDWTQVNPRGLPEWTMINCIEPSPFDGGTAYIVGTRYKLDDQKPYLYRTRDYGQTWTKITSGIKAEDFTRSLRADPEREGVLYCGTEHGMYISFDDGDEWQTFQMNLPEVPITDLAIKDNSLVVATQGRSFWVLDDLSFIYKLRGAYNFKLQEVHLFSPNKSYRTKGYQKKNPLNEGTNAANGVLFNYWLAENRDSAKIELTIFNEDGKEIRTISNKGEDKNKALRGEKGMNQFIWNMRVEGVKKVDKMVLWNGTVGDYKVPPGKYKARLKVEELEVNRDFVILKDPNYSTTASQYVQQFNFLQDVRNKFDETQKTIKNIRAVRGKITSLKKNLGDDYPEDLDSLGSEILEKLSTVENELVQTKAKSGQDVLNYPIKLNDKLSGLFRNANQETAPSAQIQEAYKYLKEKIDLQIYAFDDVMNGPVKNYNRLILNKKIDFIRIAE